MAQNANRKLLEFFLRHKKVAYKKGNIIIRSDETPSGVFYLLQGYVKDYCLSYEGKSFSLILFKEKDIFPHNWIFNKTKNDHIFEAFTDCILLRASREEFMDFLANNPDVLLLVTQNVLIRMGGLFERMEQLAFGNAEKRVSSIILIFADRFGKKTPEGTLIPVPLSHKEIAEFIGITRETASIEIKKLERANIIVRSSKSYIVKKHAALLKKSAAL
ncbi:MAG: Crp/Fnr family transcriptional regulator [Candidatus Levyibacteriota bacterium]